MEQLNDKLSNWRRGGHKVKPLALLLQAIIDAIEDLQPELEDDEEELEEK